MKFARIPLLSILSLFCLILFSLSPASAQSNPVPFINQPLSPASAAPGTAGITLTVHGTGFASTSLVQWNGSSRTTSFLSTSELTAAITTADLASAGFASVTVLNAAPANNRSNSVLFTITPSRPSINVSVGATFTTGNGPVGLVAADFNGDGKTDVAVADEGGNTLSVLLGNGDGTFQPHTVYATGGGPTNLVVGDFNADGKLDLAVTNLNDGTVSILLGNGDGTFRAQVPYTTGTEADGIVTGDFNGDGILDLAVTNYTANTVSVLLGVGDGTFQPQTVFTVGANPEGITLGDFNADGKLDLAVANYSANTISILLGNGDGTFQPQTTVAVGMGPEYLLTGDFNGDGKLDLAVPNRTDSTLGILLGNGDGTFQAQHALSVGKGPLYVSSGDFNGDGILDLVVSSFDSKSVTILLGNGAGAFLSQPRYSTGANPEGMAAADFNGDGLLDVVAAGINNSVSVLLQTTAIFSAKSVTFNPQVVGVSSPGKTFNLTNTGSASFTISGFAITGKGAAAYSQTNTCGSSLAAGASCAITVKFDPSATGPFTATLAVTDSAPGGQQSISLSGYGTEMQVTPTFLNFGNQTVGTTSSPMNVFLKNKGATSIAISNINLSGLNAADFKKTTTCPLSLPPARSCMISVEFTPSATGKRTAQLLFTLGDSGVFDVSLSGTGD